MKQAVIFALEASNYEPNYEKMAILLVRSLRDTNPDIDIYCGIFTERMPCDGTLKRLELMDVKIVSDVKFNTGPNAVNYFLRNYCCHYFASEMDLLAQYDRLIYLDIDVIVLNALDFDFPSNGLLVERVPDKIVQKEKEYIGEVDYPLYYNWVSVVTEQNKGVFNIDYAKHTYMKESDKQVSMKITASGLELVDQQIGAYYPKHELTSNSVLFHYDGFIDSGSFYKLEEHNPALYKKYWLYATKAIGLELANDQGYWNGF